MVLGARLGPLCDFGSVAAFVVCDEPLEILLDRRGGPLLVLGLRLRRVRGDCPKPPTRARLLAARDAARELAQRARDARAPLGGSPALRLPPLLPR